MSSAPSTASHKRVQVCIRVRPPVPPSSVSSSSSSVVVDASERTISVVTNPQNGSGTCFHFDQVLAAETTQSGVYQAAASEIVNSVLDGYNGTVMAYGQTGAGKTFTMSGGKRHFDDRGICARAISSVFQRLSQDSDHSYVVRVSYVEVYNETLYDLLNFNESLASSNREELVIQENDKGQTFVRGLQRPIVKTEEHAFDLLFQGETNRTIAEHCLNASSTRSHCIFTVYIEKQVSDDGVGDTSGSIYHSKLHLVDLAGSERMKKTHVSGVMLKEASHINKSLTFLEQVVIALGDKKRQHVPYRQTPLTNLLKDSLGGNCRTMLIACVWPEDSHSDQTLATLKFATRMMRVKTSAVVNVNGSIGKSAAMADVQKYLNEIKRLKEELAMHDTLSGRSLVEYDVTKIQSAGMRARYREQIGEFIRDPGKSPAVQSLTQVTEVFRVFREMLLDKELGHSTATPPAVPLLSVGRSTSESKMVKQFRAMRASSPQSPGLPLLASQAKNDHPEVEATGNNDEEEARTRLPLIRPASPAQASAITPPTQPFAAPDRPMLSDKERFEQFKQQRNPTPESLLDLDVAKQNLKAAKAQATDIGLEINKIKLNIDSLTLKLQDVRVSSADSSTGPEASTASVASSPDVDFVVLQLKDAKKQYRESFDRFQEKKAEVKYLLKIKEQMLQKVTREFEAWQQRVGAS